MADGDTDWRTEAGLAEETTSARIYPSKVQKRRWKQESGDKSLSRYIIEHVEEARYHRQQNTQENSADQSEKRQLENRIEELENQLEKAQNRGTPEEQKIYSPDVVKQALTGKPRTQDEILQKLLENPRFQQLVADRVEKTLYSLASEGRIEFVRNPTGWKTVQGGDES
jgi:hypothetical protein